MKIVRVTLTTIMLLSGRLLFADNYNGNDISRILYKADAPHSFLILRKITSEGTLRCSYYGKKKVFTVSPESVRKTFFFEHSSPFVVSQYLCYYRTRGINSQYIFALANKIGESTERMELFNNYMSDKKSLQDKFREALKKAARISDIDDRLDLLHEVLENSTLDNHIFTAANNFDWILAITLLKDYTNLMRYFASVDRRKHSFYTEVQSKINDLEDDILSNFKSYMNYKSPLQDRFTKLYPESRSFWRQAPPTSIDKLYALHLNCLQAYFKLDKLSSIMESEKWGNAMLDSLLLIEQTSAADNLVKEFEREIAVLEKIAAAKKQQATDKTTKDNN